MLVDVGCKWVILGHSERRHKLGETDAFINRKVHAALAAGLHVILCLGETLDERKGDRTETVLDAQLTGSLAGLDAAACSAWCWPTSRSGPSAPATTPRRNRRSRPTPTFVGESPSASARKRPAAFLYSTAAA